MSTIDKDDKEDAGAKVAESSRVRRVDESSLTGREVDEDENEGDEEDEEENVPELVSS